MTDAPDKLFCWNFQTENEAWEEWGGGYCRKSPMRPIDKGEQNNGAEYIRKDLHDKQIAELSERLDRAVAQISADDDIIMLHEASIAELEAERDALQAKLDRAIAFVFSCSKDTPAQYASDYFTRIQAKAALSELKGTNHDT